MIPHGRWKTLKHSRPLDEAAMRQYGLLARSLSMIVLAAGLCGAEVLPVDAKALGGAAAATPFASLWDRGTLTGDWAGVCTRLETAGITLSAQEQSEVWANLAGGLRTGTAANGLLTAALTVDPARILPWTSTTFFVNAFQIHGRGPSTKLGRTSTLSSIEATPSTKLYNLWIESQLFGDRLSVRLGQGGANDELMLALSAALFLNSSLGFPDWLAQNLPSGGPNYPLATPMVRARFTLTDGLSLVGVAFNGDPAGPGPGDPQERNSSGTAFRLEDPVLAFAESGTRLGRKHRRVCFRASTRSVPSTTRGSSRIKRATASAVRWPIPPAAASPSLPRQLWHLWPHDQMLWRVPGTNDQGLSAFGLVMAGPDARNREHFPRGRHLLEGADRAAATMCSALPSHTHARATRYGAWAPRRPR